MPDYLELWATADNSLVLPRGYAHRLEQVAQGTGVEVEWERDMVVVPHSESPFRDWPEVELRDYQVPARDAMLDWAQGIYRAPTASGKTVTTLEFIRWAGQKTLVIVGKTSLARQWQEEIRTRYGYESGYVGEGVFDVRDITVVLWQTLWTRRDRLDESFWRDFGCVVCDEIHHAGAQSLSELLSLFPAFYRIGVSATPRWDEGSWPIVEALVGPLIHTTSSEDIGDKLVKPSVVVVPTEFEAEYVPTHYEHGRRVQNNYSELMSRICEDRDRNDLVAKIAREEAQEGHHVLVVTRRIEHVKQLVSRLEKVLRLGQRLHVLTGAQTGADAERIKRSISCAESGTVLVTTVAEEGFDCPPLDRLILAFPLRKLPLVEQQIGRVRRPAPGKNDAVVYDVTDERVGPLGAQARERSRLYARRRYEVSRMETTREDSLTGTA